MQPNSSFNQNESEDTFETREGKLKPVKIGDPYLLSCGHEGKIVWISQNGEEFAVKAYTGAGSCCNHKSKGGKWTPTVFLIKKRQPQTKTTHLTTLVNRFLRTLENLKVWNQLDNIDGERKLRHHVSNIIEYTFYIHKQQVTEEEVEKLTHLLEEGGNHT